MNSAAHKLTAQKTTCFKCHGKGILSFHTNIAGGRCFACGGTGVAKHRVAVRPVCDGSTLYVGDGTSRGLDVDLSVQHSRADQLEIIGDILRASADMIAVAMRIAVLGCPRAQARARAHFADGEAFDSLVSQYTTALRRAA